MPETANPSFPRSAWERSPDALRHDETAVGSTTQSVATCVPTRSVGTRRSWGWLLLLLFAFPILAYLLFFHSLAERDLWSSHEARAAQNAQTMLETGDWLLPRLYDGRVEMQKPPLYYWLVAGAAWLRGGPVDAWAVRLPAALSAVACALGVFLLAWRLGRPLAGLLAALMLATMLHYTWLGRTGRIDMPLTFMISAALGGFYLRRFVSDQGRGGEAVAWRILAYVALAAGVLLKGPIPLVLVLVVALPRFLNLSFPRFCVGIPARRERSASRRARQAEISDGTQSVPEGVYTSVGRPSRAVRSDLRTTQAGRPTIHLRTRSAGTRQRHLLWGLPLVLALTLPWFLWANHRTGGEFLHEFVFKHNLQRGLGDLPGDVLGGDETLEEHPWWHYTPRLLGDLFPWSLLLPIAVIYFLRGARWRDDAEARFGLIWLTAMLVFLSCMRFKRADYLLPAYPGAALFLGCTLERWIVDLSLRERRRLSRSERSTIRRAALAAFAGVVLAAGVGWTVFVDQVLPRSEAAREQRRFADAVRERVPRPGLVLLFRTESHALVFHLGKSFDRIMEWENLDVWACQPAPVYVIMPAECVREWPRFLEAGKLFPVLSNEELAGGVHEEPLVLLCNRPVER